MTATGRGGAEATATFVGLPVEDRGQDVFVSPRLHRRYARLNLFLLFLFHVFPFKVVRVAKL